MNNAKMWLVVKPTVGVPLFLSAVAIGSFAVHVAVLTNTSWVSDFLSGQELGAGEKYAAVMEATPAVATGGLTQPPTEVDTGTDGRTPVLVMLTERTPARSLLENTVKLEFIT